MICKKDEISTFEEKTEMADGGESSQELTVEGGAAGSSVGKFPWIEGKGGPGLLHTFVSPL